MKKNILEFIKRGLMAASGGPLVASIVYFILSKFIEINLTADHYLLITVTSSLLAFIIAGISIVWQIEKINLLGATSIHYLVLYITYLTIYLINGWLAFSWVNILIFTGIFIIGYFFIWGIVIISVKVYARKANEKLKIRHSSR